MRPEPARDAWIIRLRKERNLPAAEIVGLLTREEKIPVSGTTVARVIRQAGLPIRPDFARTGIDAPSSTAACREAA